MLKKLDLQKAKNIDKNNKVRLIRAIEIAKVIRKIPQRVKDGPLPFEVLKIGLTIPPKILKERIYNRIISRIKEGMLEEIKSLHDKGLSWKRMNELGLEYRYLSEYLKYEATQPSQKLKKIKKQEMIEKLNTKTWHYAKRQKTWFKRDKNTIWINPLKNNEKSKAFKAIEKFLK